MKRLIRKWLGIEQDVDMTERTIRELWKSQEHIEGRVNTIDQTLFRFDKAVGEMDRIRYDRSAAEAAGFGDDVEAWRADKAKRREEAANNITIEEKIDEPAATDKE